MPGDESVVFEVHGVRVGLLICEDAWFAQPAQDAKDAGAQLLVVLNASPFHRGKSQERESAMQQRCIATGLPLVYAHLVGGQDEVVFEGRSFALQSDGLLAGRALAFAEDAFDVHCTSVASGLNLQAPTHELHEDLSDVWHALVMGVRGDFPGDSMADLVAYARANPGKLSYAVDVSSGLGLVAARAFVKRAGLDIVEVPYRSTPQMIQDTMAGRVPAVDVVE